MWNKWLHRNVNHPAQIQFKHYGIVSIFGKIGFFTKGLIYSFIGGLTLQSTFTSIVQNESPQGVFILLGSAPDGASHFYLIAILAGVIIYTIWRFWEGITGQGYDPTFTARKNFFRYRLSPLASGFVYTLYAAYITSLFDDDKIEPGTSHREDDSTCFPLCWRDSVVGKFGLILLAVAFTIATITQLIPAFTKTFHKEINYNRFDTTFGKIMKIPYFITGHLGFLARAVLFFLVSFLFWKIVLGERTFIDPKQATVAQAINSIRDTTLGKVIMTALGIGLILYGVFAALCTYFKIFPTPPPSGNVTLPEHQDDPNVDPLAVQHINIPMENLPVIDRNQDRV